MRGFIGRCVGQPHPGYQTDEVSRIAPADLANRRPASAGIRLARLIAVQIRSAAISSGARRYNCARGSQFWPKCRVEYRDGSGNASIPTFPYKAELRPYDLDELRRATAALEGLRNAVGTVNRRPPGWHNHLIQLAKKLLARLLTWYTRPLHEFHASVSRSLEEIVRALDHVSMSLVTAVDHLSMNMVALEGRLAQSEKRRAAVAESMQEQLELLHEQVKALVSLQRTTNPDAPASRMETDWDKRACESSRFDIDMDVGSDRTVYVIGLFGSGRSYLTELMLHNIGERGKYVRDTIRLHPGPTPMIYSGHATMKYVSRAQYLPSVMTRILESVRSGFADLIFLYRHPLDSLLTNWIWWRTYLHDHRMIKGISQVYKSSDDLCADLEKNFVESFAEGDPGFFAAAPGRPFLSFPEFSASSKAF